MCGATDLMKSDASAAASFAGIMRQQAQSIFGDVKGVFGDLINSLSPVAAAGSGQEGLTPAQMAAAKSQAITENAAITRSEGASVRERLAAEGGGNMMLPSGAAVGTELALGEQAAGRQAKALSDIEAQSRELGLRKWQFAEEGLGKAPGMFGVASQAGEAGTQAGTSSTGAASEVAQADMSPWNAAIGAIGGISGKLVGGLVPGGGG